jgi:hypothetical protein
VIVYQLWRSNMLFTDQLSQPGEQDFQPSLFWRLRQKQAVLGAVRCGRLCS